LICEAHRVQWYFINSDLKLFNAEEEEGLKGNVAFFFEKSLAA